MRTRRIAPLSLIAALALAAPAQAEKIPGKEFAKALKPELTKSLKVRATKVTCPKRVNNRKGGVFHCTARFVSGDSVRVRVKLLDRNGSFRMSLADVMLRHLETQLEGYLPQEAEGATVQCPRKRTVKKNDKFTCTAVRDDASVGKYEITQMGNGLVKYGWFPAQSAP